MEYLRVKNWAEFQHYKDRNPPWIKLHRTLLDDYEFSCLQDASKAHLMLIWLFASQKDGLVPNDPKFLKMKLGLTQEPNLKWFINHGLLIPEQDASNLLAECEQSAPREEAYKTAETYKTAEAERAPKNGALPDWIPQEPWRAWLEVRTKIKAPNTHRALKLAVVDLERLRGEGQDPGAVLDQATKRGWKALYAVKPDFSAPPDYSAVIATLKD